MMEDDDALTKPLEAPTADTTAVPTKQPLRLAYPGVKVMLRFPEGLATNNTGRGAILGIIGIERPLG